MQSPFPNILDFTRELDAFEQHFVGILKERLDWFTPSHGAARFGVNAKTRGTDSRFDSSHVRRFPDEVTGRAARQRRPEMR
jgi:hypothetical protein